MVIIRNLIDNPDLIT